VNRRHFLQRLGGALGTLTTAASGVWGTARAAERERPLHVVVVGAGPAGLAAAIELVERGVFVTLVESAGQVGGKAKGWTEDLDGTAVDVESGVHRWTERYVHLNDLFVRYGLDEHVQRVRPSDVAMRIDGHAGVDLRGGALRRVLSQRARALGGASYRRARAVARAWRARLQIDPDGAREAIGTHGLAEWHTFLRQAAEAGAHMLPRDLVAQTLAPAEYFTRPETLDALTFALGEPLDSETLVADGNPQELFWEPLAAAFRAQRGKLRLSTRVDSLIVDNQRVVGVRVGERERSWRVERPTETGWMPVEGAEESVFVGRLADGTLAAIDGRCTHAGCGVGLADDGGFACPCHGGRYDTTGTPIAGPPPRPLERGRVEEDGDGVVVKLGGTLEDLAADAVILAVDARTLGTLCAELVPRTRKLSTTRHVVGRFWFDRDVTSDRASVVRTERAATASAGFLLHRLQASARQWAAANGGSVIELQAAGPFGRLSGDPRTALLDALEADCRLIWPELRTATLKKRALADGHEFTHFVPGWYRAAVQVDTRVPGLYAAGDHIVIDRDCQRMERAVTTGRMAANAVLSEHGLPTAPILPA
jgi:isorenieratene synthase